MPDTLRKDLIDLVWQKVEARFLASPTLRKQFLPGNRSRQTEMGWLREMTRSLDSDFGAWKCAVEKLDGPAWPTPTLASESNRFRTSTTDFVVSRSARIVFTIRVGLPPERDETVNLGDEIASAIFEAGPKLGVDWVVDTGQAVVEESPTPAGEEPSPGKIITVTFEVQCQQMGRALLTAISI